MPLALPILNFWRDIAAICVLKMS